jgi:hypothetical protein
MEGRGRNVLWTAHRAGATATGLRSGHGDVDTEVTEADEPDSVETVGVNEAGLCIEASVRRVG